LPLVEELFAILRRVVVRARIELARVPSFTPSTSIAVPVTVRRYKSALKSH
jgi:hypothetical protein